MRRLLSLDIRWVNCAQQMAIDYPEIVAGLVLVNTFSHLRPHHASEWIYLLRRGLITTAARSGSPGRAGCTPGFPSQRSGSRGDREANFGSRSNCISFCDDGACRFDSGNNLGLLKCRYWLFVATRIPPSDWKTRRI